MKPDWTTAPGWAKYWAFDDGGYAYWYPEKPDLLRLDSVWSLPRVSWKFDRQDKGCPPRIWKDSLCERPAK